MKQRDGAQAANILRAHIRAGRDNVLADLRQRQHIRATQESPLLD
jgi:hypothetical protein